MRPEPRRQRVGRTTIAMAVVLFLGILVLGAGHYRANRAAFYAGLLLVLAGVMGEIAAVLMRERHPPAR